jgi:glutathione synthase
MDPIASINIKKDSSFALLLEAQRRGYEMFYLEQRDLFLRDGKGYGSLRPIRVLDDPSGWFSLEARQDRLLSEMDLILMRKDPPYDAEYLYSTYILEFAHPALVVNNPRALRDANEKIFAQQFAELCPPTLVTRERTGIRDFLAEHGDIVVKPLDAMGGASVFRLRTNDPNISVVLEVMTEFDRRTVMAQRYIPEVVQGDKRILLFDGEPAPYALARVPAKGETRANMAAGGVAKGVALSERDREICHKLGPELSARGLWFVGIDVIGNYLTEVNVTSPTGIRELDRFFNVNLAGILFDALELRLRAR